MTNKLRTLTVSQLAPLKFSQFETSLLVPVNRLSPTTSSEKAKYLTAFDWVQNAIALPPKMVEGSPADREESLANLATGAKFRELVKALIFCLSNNLDISGHGQINDAPWDMF